MIKLSPSILSADFSKLGDQIRLLDNSGTDLIHIDVMDGNFVPNITFGVPVIKSIRPHTDVPFDVHLMIDQPSKYIEDFAKAGADYITVHYESETHLDRLIDYIKSFDKKAGIALNPSTPVELIKHLLHKVDLILVMSVNPGFGGQTLIEYTLDKIKELDKLRKENKFTYEISIDGGVSESNCQQVAATGVDIIVSGSSIFKNNEIEKNIKLFRELCKEY